MKLVIQIPCYNEADALPTTLADMPRAVEGFSEVLWLVVDDGSSDGTARVARAHGVDHVVTLNTHQGLARAFQAGVEAALALGADVIVNTDADHQYRGSDIPRLVAPILSGDADLVVGERHGPGFERFSAGKRLLQRLGSWVVRQASGTSVPDASSGFRALSHDAALRLNVLSSFTYTLETIIQAGHKNLVVAHVPVATNPPLRPSRLFRSTPQYVMRSASTIVRIYAMYRPLRVFLTIGFLFVVPGLALCVRFLAYYVADGGSGHVQSLIFAAVLLIVGFQVMLIGLVADLIAGQRRLTEEVLYRQRKQQFDVTRGESGRSLRP